MLYITIYEYHKNKFTSLVFIMMEFKLEVVGAMPYDTRQGINNNNNKIYVI